MCIYRQVAVTRGTCAFVHPKKVPFDISDNLIVMKDLCQ